MNTESSASKAIGKGFTSTRLTPARRLVIDYLAEASRSHSIKGLFEMDVTEARRMLRRLRRETGSSLAFSAYLIHAFAHALDPHRELQGHIRRGKELIVFEDVDVNTVVVREVQGKAVPTIHVVRGANKKSLEEIHNEIEEARTAAAGSLITSKKGDGGAVALLERSPGFLRRIVIRQILRRNPVMKKKLFGTVSFSALPMFGRGFAYAVPITPHPVHMMVGGIEKREILRGGEVAKREIAGVTLTLDHDVADGAPVARFITLLKQIVETGSVAS